MKYRKTSLHRTCTYQLHPGQTSQKKSFINLSQANSPERTHGTPFSMTKQIQRLQQGQRDSYIAFPGSGSIFQHLLHDSCYQRENYGPATRGHVYCITGFKKCLLSHLKEKFWIASLYIHQLKVLIVRNEV